MLKQIFRRVRKGFKDVASTVEDNPLAILAATGLGLGSGILPGGKEFGLKTLLGNIGKLGNVGRNIIGGFDKVIGRGVDAPPMLEEGTGILGTGQDILGALTGKEKLGGILGLLNAFLAKKQFEKEAEAEQKRIAEQADIFNTVSNKFNSRLGGSPFERERFDVLPEGIEYRTDDDNRIIGRTDDPIYSAKGGIAQLKMGGTGGPGPSPFNPNNKISGMIPAMAMGGETTGVPGLSADMSNQQMMNKIEDNPGITAFFPRKLGMISGPGGPKEDKIPAMLSDGEFVFTAKAVENAGGPKAMYNMMNKLDPESSKGRGII